MRFHSTSAFIATIALCASGAANAADRYTLTDLGPANVTSTATSINNDGQIVGYYVDDVGFHGFVWINGVRTDIPSFGGSSSPAFGINNHGDVVGYASLPGDAQEHAFVMRNGVMTDLGTLGGPFSVAVAINDTGQIAGRSYTMADLGETAHAVLWRNDVPTDLGTLGGSFSSASDVTETRYVTGDAQLPDGRRHAFLWHDDEMIDIGTLGGLDSFANAKNRDGIIVGESMLPDFSRHAFRWQDGVMTDLGTLGGPLSSARGLNELGDIVGESDAPAHMGVHATLWRNGEILDLNALVDGAPGWAPLDANAINSNGLIVGSARHEGVLHAVLLTPHATPDCSHPVLLHAESVARPALRIPIVPNRRP